MVFYHIISLGYLSVIYIIPMVIIISYYRITYSMPCSARELPTREGGRGWPRQKNLHILLSLQTLPVSSRHLHPPLTLHFICLPQHEGSPNACRTTCTVLAISWLFSLLAFSSIFIPSQRICLHPLFHSKIHSCFLCRHKPSHITIHPPLSLVTLYAAAR